MKKVLMIAVSLGLCFQLTACTIPELVSNWNDWGTQEESIEEVTANIAESEEQESAEAASSASNAIQNFLDRAQQGTGYEEQDPEDDTLEAVRNFLERAQQSGTSSSEKSDNTKVEFDGAVQENVERYIEGFLQAIFHSDYEMYSEYASKEEGEILSAAELAYFTEGLMEYAEVDVDYVDLETMLGYVEAAEIILSAAEWEITEVEIDDEEARSGRIKMLLYPVDFFRLIEDDVDTAMSDFNAQAERLDRANRLSDDVLARMEQEYAADIRDIVDDYAFLTESLESPKSVEFYFDFSRYRRGLSEVDWERVMDILMGFDDADITV